jgi:hypothetical protein
MSVSVLLLRSVWRALIYVVVYQTMSLTGHCPARATTQLREGNSTSCFLGSLWRLLLTGEGKIYYGGGFPISSLLCSKMLINPPRYSKHFICVRMLLSMHSVIIDLCDIHIHISTCCYLTIPTSSVPRALRFNWHLLYLLPLHRFSLHVSHGQIRRTLIAHHLSVRWL